MTPETWGELSTNIKTRYDLRGKQFTSGIREAISRTLKHVPDEIARLAVSRVLGWETEWSPDQQAILQACVDIASPTPDQDTAWLDTLRRISKSRPDKAIHAVVEYTIDTFGGLDVLYHLSQTENNFHSATRERFCEAYKRQVARWRLEVGKQLLSGVMDSSYFPVPIGSTFHVAIEPSQHIPRQLSPWSEPPESFRDLLDSLKTTNSLGE